MNRIYLAVSGIIILGVLYAIWHHHVFEQGYAKRVSEEQVTVAKAQPIIKEGEIQYETILKRIYAAPAGACGTVVDPAIAIALDGLHKRAGR